MKLSFVALFMFDPALEEIKKQSLLIESLGGNITKSLEEAKKANDEITKLNTKFETEVKKINDDNAAKGATLEQIKNDVLEVQAKQGRIAAETAPTIANTRNEIAKAFETNHAKIAAKGTGKWFDLDQKAVGTMTASSNLTGSVVLSYNLTPAVRGRQAVHIRDMVQTIPSATGVWTFYRQNDPVGEGSVLFQTTHGAAKSQLDYDLTQVTVNAEYLAGYSRVARQMMQDLPFLQTFVNNELIEDYLRRESFEFFGSLSTGATGATTTAASVTVEKIIDYAANLMQNNHNPNAIVVRPAVWATILKTKPNDYSIPGGVVISPTGDVMILGMPLVACTTNALSDTKVLIGDFSKAAIIQTDGLGIGMFEQDQDNVIKNLVTIRVEARVGFAMLRPEAFVYGNS